MLQTHTIVTPASMVRASLVAAVLLLWLAVSSGSAFGQSTPPVPATVPLADNAVEVLPKTITYGVMAALIDVGIGTVITGDVVSGTAMAVVGSTSGWLLYQVHEMAWDQLQPSDQPAAARTATFTVANVLRLFGVGFAFTGDVVLSGTFVVLDGVAETGAYVATDLVWTYVVEPLMAKPPGKHGV